MAKRLCAKMRAAGVECVHDRGPHDAGVRNRDDLVGLIPQRGEPR